MIHSPPQGQAYVLYTLLWNLGTKAPHHPAIAFLALKFLLAASHSEKFSVQKVEERLKFFIKLAMSKQLGGEVVRVVVEETVELLANPLLHGLTSWQLYTNLLENITLHALPSRPLCLSLAPRLFHTTFTAEVEVVRCLVDLVGEDKGDVAVSLPSTSLTLPSMVSLLDCLVRARPPKGSTLEKVALASLALTEGAPTLPAAPRLLTSLVTHLLAALRALPSLAEGHTLVTTSTALVGRLATALPSLPSADTKTHQANLASQSLSLATVFYQAKLYPPCRSLLKTSLDSVDLTKKGLARQRHKLLAEVLWRVGEHRAALASLARGLLAALEEEEAGRLLQEGGKTWVLVKREWQKAGGGAEVHATSLAGLGLEGELGEVSKENLAALGRAEVTWYRTPYLAGDTLTESWIGAAAALARVSKDRVDHGMVLLEQAWVFWLGDNTEDLEMGARCAEKAASLLAGEGLGLGWALYLRFLCEHRLLQLQVLAGVEAAEQAKALERREREGQGPGQAQDTEVTPAFPGLQLALQEQLASYLREAVRGWARVELEPSGWLPARTLLDIMLGVAMEQRRLGESGRQALLLVAEVAARLGEVEHEVVALGELVGLEGEGRWEEVDRLLTLGRQLEEKKTNSASGLQVGKGGSLGLLARAFCKRIESQRWVV